MAKKKVKSTVKYPRYIYMVVHQTIVTGDAYFVPTVFYSVLRARKYLKGHEDYREFLPSPTQPDLWHSVDNTETVAIIKRRFG